jgi:hypothetical protein
VVPDAAGRSLDGTMADARDPLTTSDYAPTSMPSTGARILAFGAILLAGVCGGLIGYGVTDVTGGSSLAAGIGALVGAVAGAAGVGVVAVLALRAMAEWRAVEHRES